MGAEPIWAVIVADVMTPVPASLHATCSIRAAQRLLAARPIEHVPIVLGRRVIGILSDRDVSAALVKNQSLDTEIAGLMTPNPKTVKPTTPLLEAARILAEARIHCLPVVNEEGALVGIVTPTDLLRALIRIVEPPAA